MATRSFRCSVSGWVQLGLVVGVALGLRVYRIADYTTFQGDQGIDALAMRRLLVDHVLPFEGPATSAGGVHLGPAYYYLLAPPLLAARFDPLGDAVFIALLGALATGLLYALARLWYGRAAAFAAAVLYGVSPAVIEASRSAWNPAPAPFFVLLGLVSLEGFRRQRNGRWLVLVGLAMGCVVQLHYFTVGLVLVTLAAAAWLVARRRDWRMAAWGFAGVAVAVLLLAPLIAHQLASGYPDVRAALQVVGGASAPVGSDSLPRRLYAVMTPTLIGGFLTAGIEPLAIGVTLILLAALGLGLQDKQTRFASALIGSLLLAMLAQAVVYRGPIPQHYVLAYAPAVYLLLAGGVASAQRWCATRAGCAAALLGLLAVNLLHLPFGVPDRQLLRTTTVATLIEQAAGDQRYSLWLLAADDSDAAYRYQLERIGRPPVNPDEALPHELFVVCQARACDMEALRAAVGPDWAAGRLDWQAQAIDTQIVRLVLPE